MISTKNRTIRYAGFDPGSGFGSLIITSIMIEDGKIVEKHPPLKLTIPSLIGNANFAKFTNDRATKTTATLADVMRENEMALGYNRKEYFIGPLAETEGTNTTSAKGALKRYTDIHSRLLFLAMYASLVDDEDSEVRLVTGAPMSLFDRDTRAAIKKNLEGEHPFTFNGKEHVVRVKVGTVTREGVKALSLYGNAKARQGIIDIGERTTDIGQTDGQTPINRWCKAETYGVGKVIDTLINEVRARYKRSLRISEARAILKAYTDERPIPPVKVGKTPIPEEEIIAIIEGAKSSEWNAIDTFTDATWNEEGTEVGSNLELILCIGGGAKVWQHELKAKFPQAIFPQDSDLFPGESEEAILIANAEAYHNLAFDLEDIDPNIWKG